jgi:cellulose synthase/poly-beta-1,6-N-acetylglucosamine synthase-like glycosyltransferase
LIVLGLLAVYQWVLAVAALIPSRQTKRPAAGQSRFIVLIPAHNEEDSLAATLKSFDALQYSRCHIRIIVIADRCDDRTKDVARRSGAEALERTAGPAGKGAAIAWAVEVLRKSGAYFDGLVIVDADTVVDPQLLNAFDRGLCAGHDVQQGYNYLSNPWDSPFTRIIAVTSVLRNGLFYSGKERLGLTSMLSGTGMCFSRYIIERYRWTALSVGEDWEFSVFLLLNGETIHFNKAARVFALESRGFRQASTQRLRWASGRQGVASASTAALFRSGVRQRRLELWDAALSMLAPTYSVQATLALLCLGASWYLSAEPGWGMLFRCATLVTGLLVAYFAAGVALTDAPIRALAGIVLIPIFLPWRTAIELLGVAGYGRKRWVRTARLSASRCAHPH